MPKKISELVAAIDVNDDDLLTFARPPFGPTDNFSCLPPQLLNRSTGHEKVFGANGSTLTFDAAANVALDLLLGTEFDIIVDGVTVAEFVNSGLALGAGSGSSIDISGDLGASLSVGGADIALASGPGGQVQVQYDDDNPAEWVGGSPPDLSIAVNRLRSAVVSLLGGPVP